MTKPTLLFLLFFVIFFQFRCKKDCNQGGNCDLEPNPGHCFAAITKYYFDKDDGKCKRLLGEDAMELCRLTVWKNVKNVSVITNTAFNNV